MLTEKIAVEYGNGRVKIHPLKTLQRKDIERIKRPVTRHLRLTAKRNEIVFVVLARKRKTVQIYHRDFWGKDNEDNQECKEKICMTDVWSEGKWVDC